MADNTNLYFAKTHEWIRVEGEFAYVGISDFAQNSMGDIVYVELPDVGEHFTSENDFAVVESVKAASEIYLPVDGEIVDINTDLEDKPALINENAYDNWLVKIKVDNKEEIKSLMNKEKYEAFCQ